MRDMIPYKGKFSLSSEEKIDLILPLDEYRKSRSNYFHYHKYDDIREVRRNDVVSSRNMR